MNRCKLIDVGAAPESGIFTLPEAVPAVRARAIQESLVFLDEFAEGLAPRVRARMAPESLAIIEGALPMDWLDAPHTREVIDAVIAELGEARAPELWRELMVHRLVQSPLLKGIIGLLNRINGQSPWTMMKALPRGWGNAYRDFGIPSLDRRGPGDVQVTWEAIPDYLFEHRQHWVAIRGVLEGLVMSGGQSGEVTLAFEPDQRVIRAQVRW